MQIEDWGEWVREALQLAWLCWKWKAYERLIHCTYLVVSRMASKKEITAPNQLSVFWVPGASLPVEGDSQVWSELRWSWDRKVVDGVQKPTWDRIFYVARSLWAGACNFTIFLSRRLFLNRIYFEWDSPGSAITNHKTLIDVTALLDRNCLSFTKEKVY